MRAGLIFKDKTKIQDNGLKLSNGQTKISQRYSGLGLFAFGLLTNNLPESSSHQKEYIATTHNNLALYWRVSTSEHKQLFGGNV